MSDNCGEISLVTKLNVIGSHPDEPCSPAVGDSFRSPTFSVLPHQNKKLMVPCVIKYDVGYEYPSILLENKKSGNGQLD